MQTSHIGARAQQEEGGLGVVEEIVKWEVSDGGRERVGETREAMSSSATIPSRKHRFSSNHRS